VVYSNTPHVHPNVPPSFTGGLTYSRSSKIIASLKLCCSLALSRLSLNNNAEDEGAFWEKRDPFTLSFTVNRCNSLIPTEKIG
jgi:hypothetical protein